MDYILDGFREAINLILSLDKEIFDIVLLSLFVSTTATIVEIGRASYRERV